jgi:hypothetical protein
MKKGPVCYIYYKIKDKRELKLKQEEKMLEQEKIHPNY